MKKGVTWAIVDRKPAPLETGTIRPEKYLKLLEMDSFAECSTTLA